MNKIELQPLLPRPLSLIAAILAVLLIVYEVIQIASGNLYQEALDNMDGTTLVELGILILLGIFTLRDRTDLQAVSFTLVAGLSFIFLYEAIYKWSFFLAPFRMQMPPAEFREFVIQIGIAATILTGFAIGFFTLRKWTFIWLALFSLLWIFWLLVGFPQIIPVDFTPGMTYLLNRSTKLLLFFAYLTIFPSQRRF